MGLAREFRNRSRVTTTVQKPPKNINNGRLVRYNGTKYISTGLTIDISNVQNVDTASPTGKKLDSNEFRKIKVVNGKTQLSDETYFLGRKIGSKALRFYLNESKNNSTIDLTIKGTKLKPIGKNKSKIDFSKLPKFTMYEQQFAYILKTGEAKYKTNLTQESVYDEELKKTNGRSVALPQQQKGGGSRDVQQSKKSNPRQNTKVRFTNRSLAPSSGQRQTQPYFLQRYRFKSPQGEWVNVNRKYNLDIIPNSVDFSQLSATWSEIDRAGDYSLVDWSRNNLLKVSFRFLVAANNVTTNGIHNTFNGLQISIDDELQVLRGLAGTKAPVQLVNFSDYLTNTYRFPFIGKKEGIYFIIADMSISATRFVADESGSNRKGSMKNIAAAEVTVTLTEYPKQAKIPIVPLPGLIAQEPVQQKDVPPADNTGAYVLASEEIDWLKNYSSFTSYLNGYKTSPNG